MHPEGASIFVQRPPWRVSRNTMSRPMALGLVLLVLFLTSQSEWKPPRGQLETVPGTASVVLKKEQFSAKHEGIKEEIILMLELEKEKLKERVNELESLLGQCRSQHSPADVADAGLGAYVSSSKAAKREAGLGQSDDRDDERIHGVEESTAEDRHSGGSKSRSSSQRMAAEMKAEGKSEELLKARSRKSKWADLREKKARQEVKAEREGGVEESGNGTKMRGDGQGAWLIKGQLWGQERRHSGEEDATQHADEEGLG